MGVQEREPAAGRDGDGVKVYVVERWEDDLHIFDTPKAAEAFLSRDFEEAWAHLSALPPNAWRTGQQARWQQIGYDAARAEYVNAGEGIEVETLQPVAPMA